MTYEVLTTIVVINAVLTLVLWVRAAKRPNGPPRLNKKAATALWRSDPIVPKHDPPKAAGGEYSSMARDVDRRFFADFRDFADVVNRSLAEGEFTASRFRLQDLPDGDLSLNVDTSDGPTLGRCFAIYFNQTRVGRLEISPRYDYTSDIPEVYTNVEINWGRFFGYVELIRFLGDIAWHATTGDPKNDDYSDARWNIRDALTRTLWDYYHVSEFDQAVDKTDEWGELIVSFHGTASCYIRRRDALKRPKSR